MADIVLGATVLVLRLGVVVGLYVFLAIAFRTLYREMAAAARSSDAAPPEPIPSWLEVVDCDDVPSLVGKVYPLDAASSIGRDPGNTVMIPDPRISKQHARLLWHSGNWWVEDLGSANGTFLNGRSLAGPTRLGGDDQLRLGPATLRVRVA